METIIPPVDRNLLKSELTADKFLRDSNNGNTQIYIVTYKNSPNVMNEIGRLREISFREAGGGTGKSIDIDKFDIDEKTPYTQLIVWDEEDQEITGGYRYIHGKDIVDDVENKLATTQLFDMSDEFITDYLPYTIELGRSFVQPKYQFSNNRKKGMYALDNLWDGLGALTVKNPDVKYFFGKITMYKHFNVEARNHILSFFSLYFLPESNLVSAKEPIFIPSKEDVSFFAGNDYQKDYALLSKTVRGLGENIPPLFSAYMNLSPSMKYFGTVDNHHFGGVEETGILINIGDIYPAKKDRHIHSL